MLTMLAFEFIDYSLSDGIVSEGMQSGVSVVLGLLASIVCFLPWALLVRLGSHISHGGSLFPYCSERSTYLTAKVVASLGPSHGLTGRFDDIERFV